MEWMNKGDRPASTTQSAAAHGGGSKGLKGAGLAWIATVILMFSVAIVGVAVVLLGLVSVFNSKDSEKSYVKSKQFQAVFLSGGQVYFGKIQNLNEKFIRMNNIYYLRVNQTVQPDGTATNNNQDISLVKLGCELHGPNDEMLINRDQVVFWENLKDDGQVAKAVADYVKNNPGAQNCATANQTTTNSTGTGTATGTQTGTSTTGTGTTTTGTGTTTTKKP